LLKEMYGIPHISTGDILRQEVAEATALGRKAESFMSGGALVPDALILEMMESRLLQPDTRRGWLLDGFPRNLAQAEGLLGRLPSEPRVRLQHSLDELKAALAGGDALAIEEAGLRLTCLLVELEKA